MLHLLSNADDEGLLVFNSSIKCISSKDKSSKNAGNRQFYEFPCPGSMKITIKNKPILESAENNINLLSWAFHTLLFHIQRTKQLYQLKLKTHEKLSNVKLRRYFRIWKSTVDDKKKVMRERKSQYDFYDERKIYLFVNAIVSKQQGNVKMLRSNSTKKCTNFDEGKDHLMAKSVSVADSSLQKRLYFQRKIITQQRWQLVQQNQMIEAMKLAKITDESQHGKKKTFTAAKKVLSKCNQRTRNDLLQLIKAEASNVNSIEPPKLVSSPPVFLSRMEARAKSRKERMREAKEQQRIKLEIQKQQEVAILREEEEKQKHLQLDAQRKAKQNRQEQEMKNIMDAEKMRIANELVGRFYKRYLLKNYILTPFVRIIEREKHHLQMADNQYNITSLRKKFTIWKNATREAIDFKTEQCILICNTNILWRFFCKWMCITKETIENYQIAWHFYAARLRKKYLRAWYSEILEIKVRSLGTQQFVMNYYDEKIKIKYFQLWETYTKISDNMNESDRQKEKWRALVQNVVPNFCPKYRGIIRDD